jgi:parallel beta-helix repeat protein
VLVATPVVPVLAVVSHSLGCGAVVRHDVRLTKDLRNCHGIGLVVDADNVTIDLNGHTIDGDGRADREGIQVIGHRRVTIMNGTVQQFVEGVVFIDSRDVALRNLHGVEERHVGVFIDGSRRVLIQDNVFDQIAFSGIFATRSTNLEIGHNRVSESGSGIALRSSTQSRIASNRVVGVDCGGIQLYDRSRHNRVEVNVVTGSGCDGISVWTGSNDNLVSHNTVRRNDAGIGVGSSVHNRVTDNAAGHNRFTGIYLFGADANRVASNVVAGNGDGSEAGIHVLANDSGAGSDENAIQRNTVVRSTGDGILIEQGSAETTLDDNVVIASSDDGIDIDSPGTALARNIANHNAELGIDAVAGVVDAGGNRAHGNGDAAQCINVSCH